MTKSISFIETQCRGAVSLVPLYFSINQGQVTTQSDASLRTILCHILSQLARVDGDHLQVLVAPDVKADVIDALFDADVRPLVNSDDVPRVAEMLDPKEKARLLAHGIAGCIALATRLSRLGVEVSADVLRHELGSFAVSTQLAHIRFLMEHSPLFSNCLMTSQIMDLITDASHDVSMAAHPKGVSFHDYEVDAFSSGYERPDRNMGLPGGFTFLVLN